MNRSKVNPHKTLWLTIPIVFMITILEPIAALDMQLHNTYYVIAVRHLALFFSIFLGLLGAAYRFLRKHKLNSVLTIIHTLGTSLCVLVIVSIPIIRELSVSKDTNLSSVLFRVQNTCK